jgi:hypothetical protein
MIFNELIFVIVSDLQKKLSNHFKTILLVKNSLVFL